MNNLDNSLLVNNLDDISRFYEQPKTSQDVGVRSPILSRFTLNRVIPQGTSNALIPRYTPNVESYGTVDLDPVVSTYETSVILFDGHRLTKAYRAVARGWHIIESDVQVAGNLGVINATLGVVLGTNDQLYEGTKVYQSPRTIATGGVATFQEQSNYRTCIYLNPGQHFFLYLVVIGSGSPINRSANIRGTINVLFVEDKFVVG